MTEEYRYEESKDTGDDPCLCFFAARHSRKLPAAVFGVVQATNAAKIQM